MVRDTFGSQTPSRPIASVFRPPTRTTQPGTSCFGFCLRWHRPAVIVAETLLEENWDGCLLMAIQLHWR